MLELLARVWSLETMKKKTSETGHPDNYAFALEQERKAWEVLHGIPRSDPRYAKALADWQAAADRIGVEAEKLLKNHPKP